MFKIVHDRLFISYDGSAWVSAIGISKDIAKQLVKALIDYIEDDEHIWIYYASTGKRKCIKCGTLEDWKDDRKQTDYKRNSTI